VIFFAPGTKSSTFDLTLADTLPATDASIYGVSFSADASKLKNYMTADNSVPHVLRMSQNASGNSDQLVDDVHYCRVSFALAKVPVAYANDLTAKTDGSVVFALSNQLRTVVVTGASAGTADIQFPATARAQTMTLSGSSLQLGDGVVVTADSLSATMSHSYTFGKDAGLVGSSVVLIVGAQADLSLKLLTMTGVSRSVSVSAGKDSSVVVGPIYNWGDVLVTGDSKSVTITLKVRPPAENVDL
jgi:hypothetical protein